MSNSDDKDLAGWYPDPHEAGRLRYFDGIEWTEHYHYEGRLPSLDTWFSATFGALKSYGGPLIALAAGLALVSSAGTWLFLQSFDHLVVVDMEVVNSSGSDALIGAIGAVLLLCWTGFGWLAVNRYLHLAHLDQKPTIQDALRTAASRLPRMLAVYLQLFAVAGLVLIVLLVAVLALGPLGIVVLLASLVAMVWVYVKLIFLHAAIVAAPGAQSPIKASADVSAKRFWPVFGRITLVVLVVGIASLIVSAIMGGRNSAIDQQLLSDSFRFEADEFIFDDLAIAELLPSGGQIVTYLLLSTIISAVTTVITSSAIMRLYLDSGAPSQV